VRGTLVAASRYVPDAPYLGLSSTLYDHLVFKTANSSADIGEVTMVEIFYRYRPITPIPGFIPGLLKSDGGGMIVSSRAVF